MKSILTVCWLAACCLLSVNTLRAQDKDKPLPCQAGEQNEIIFNNDPATREEQIKFNSFARSFAEQYRKNRTLLNANGKAIPASSTKYIIPVVVHVYGTHHNGKSITIEKIQKALEMVNVDFNGLNDDFNSVEDFFKPRRATLDIEFRLAKIDPEGNCTNGIMFHPDKSGFGNGSGYDAEIRKDAWDNYKYVNVYLQNDLYGQGVTNNSGVSWYPSKSMSDNKLARIVYNGSYLYDNSSNKEFASTLTHEFGHFFNLIHTFEGGCSGTDEVDDTPQEDGNHALKCNPGTNCGGVKVNIENYMGYNGADGCYKMFTQGQVLRMMAALEGNVRKPLWQPENLAATGVAGIDDQAGAVTSSVSGFDEALVNDGSINGTAVIELTGATFTLSSGTLTAGVHYTATGIPAGLTPVLTLENNKRVVLSFTGKAQSHNVSNNVVTKISFSSAAITGGVTALRCNSAGFTFRFRDVYGIYFVNLKDIAINKTTTWNFFSIAAGDSKDFGAWYRKLQNLKLETYGKRLVGIAGTRNIQLLAKNTVIGQGSTFVSPGSGTDDKLDITTDTYRDWVGKTGYIGFEYKLDGAPCYGWFRVTVADDGESFVITQYAYNTEPYANITTGVTGKTSIDAFPEELQESGNNDGTVSSELFLDITTNTNTFNIPGGALTNGVHYTISGVPAGLTAVLTAVNNSRLKLSFTGAATRHAIVDKATIQLSLLAAALSGNLSDYQQTQFNIPLNFSDPYGIFIVDVDYGASPQSTWTYFTLDNSPADNKAYGVAYYSTNGGLLQIESYGKKMVMNEGSTTNLKIFGSREEVGPASNFVAGGSFPNLPTIKSNSYASWIGKTGYVGLEFMVNGSAHYGWMKIAVSQDGNSFRVLQYAYNTKPGGSLFTGQALKLATISPASILESSENDGGFSDQPLITLGDPTASFSMSSGYLTEQTHYTISGVPPGISAKLLVTSATTAQLELTGKAVNHAAADATTIKVELLNAAITAGIPEGAEQDLSVKLVFIDAPGKYCIPAYSTGCSKGAINSFSILDPNSKVLYENASACSEAGAYTNYPLPVVINPSGWHTFRVTRQNSANVKCWIDFNDNGEFEETELVVANAWVQILNYPEGTYRLRIRTVMGKTDFTACSAEGEGETEDYTITFQKPISCDDKLVNTAVTASFEISTASQYITARHNECEPLVKLYPYFAGQVDLSVGVYSATLVHENTPYVPRYFEIKPAATAGGAYVHLYFSKTEFDTYNNYLTANNSIHLPLPGTASDTDPAIANIRIASFKGSGPLGAYESLNGLIKPSNVYWRNNIKGWEVVFYTTNYGGFYLTTEKDPEAARKQTISFSDISFSYGEENIDPGATASSGLPVSYSIADVSVARIVDGKIHIMGAGTTSITATQEGNADFDAAKAVTVKLTVSKAKLTVKASDITITRYDLMPAFTISYSGFVKGENEAVLTALPVAASIAGSGSEPGVYDILVQGGEAANYELVYIAGKLTIQRPPKEEQQILAAEAISKTYADIEFDAGAVASSGLPVSYTSSDAAIASIESGKIKIHRTGSVTITVTQQGSEDFLPADPKQIILTVEKAELILSADNKTREQDEHNPELTISYSGWVRNETSAVLTNLPAANTEARYNSVAGEYAIVVSGGEAANYSIIRRNGKLTIKPKSVTTASVEGSFITTSTLQVKVLSPLAGKGLLMLSNVSGRVLHQQEVELAPGSTTFRLPVANLSRGAYIITVKGNGFRVSEKIIK